ncbi:hypothetical protein PVL29_001640 [Vitis rotundifolia]|uniref:Uncharacterized protein n=1 Tax=Vitis rotundifolia TaxID=103349 RepID=A0AA39E1J7_VITRO|nr:hypothetical protein PVL29_001640 [Vitis rotundifolia]
MWSGFVVRFFSFLFSLFSLPQAGLCRTMASSFTVPSLQRPLLHKSHFLGQGHFPNNLQKASLLRTRTPLTVKASAKFDLFGIMGGRGLCNGEEGLQQELKRNIEPAPSPDSVKDEEKPALAAVDDVPEDGFEKELLGLTGGFPGGEKGLEQFLEKNPPPEKTPGNIIENTRLRKPKPPELPLLMPGGNWDRLITFRLEELQRRDKGPPMKNPKSAILETLLEKEA